MNEEEQASQLSEMLKKHRDEVIQKEQSSKTSKASHCYTLTNLKDSLKNRKPSKSTKIKALSLIAGIALGVPVVLLGSYGISRISNSNPSINQNQEYTSIDTSKLKSIVSSPETLAQASLSKEELEAIISFADNFENVYNLYQSGNYEMSDIDLHGYYENFRDVTKDTIQSSIAGVTGVNAKNIVVLESTYQNSQFYPTSIAEKDDNYVGERIVGKRLNATNKLPKELESLADSYISTLGIESYLHSPEKASLTVDEFDEYINKLHDYTMSLVDYSGMQLSYNETDHSFGLNYIDSKTIDINTDYDAER